MDPWAGVATLAGRAAANYTRSTRLDYWAPIVDQPIETAGCYANSKNP